MAIYRLPPSPFVGGRQPLAPKDLNPEFEHVEEIPYDPFVRPLIALLSWNDTPVYIQKQVFTPTVEEFVPYTNPLIALRSWEPLPLYYQNRVFTPQEEAVVSEVIPYRFYASIIVNNWGDVDYPIQTKFNLPAEITSVDFTPAGRQQLSVTLDNWPLPTLNVKIASLIPFVAPTADDPPFSSRDFRIVNIWNILEYPFVQQYPKLAQEVVINDPPFGQRIWLNTVIRAWEPPPPHPTVPKLSFTPPPNNPIIWLWKRVL